MKKNRAELQIIYLFNFLLFYSINRPKKEEKETKGRKYYTRQIRQESFDRLIHLPSEVEMGKNSAEYKNGVLKIHLTKKQHTSQNRIEVKVQ